MFNKMLFELFKTPVVSLLRSLPEHELQEESRDLEEEQEAAGMSAGFSLPPPPSLVLHKRI